MQVKLQELHENDHFSINDQTIGRDSTRSIPTQNQMFGPTSDFKISGSVLDLLGKFDVDLPSQFGSKQPSKN